MVGLKIDDVSKYLDNTNYETVAANVTNDLLSGDASIRMVHRLVADYAERVAEQRMDLGPFSVTTTHHDEAVILTNRHERGSTNRHSFGVRLREDTELPFLGDADFIADTPDEDVDDLRERIVHTVATYVREVANETTTAADHHFLREEENRATTD